MSLCIWNVGLWCNIFLSSSIYPSRLHDEHPQALCGQRAESVWDWPHREEGPHPNHCRDQEQCAHRQQWVTAAHSLTHTQHAHMHTSLLHTCSLTASQIVHHSLLGPEPLDTTHMPPFDPWRTAKNAFNMAHLVWIHSVWSVCCFEG